MVAASAELTTGRKPRPRWRAEALIRYECSRGHDSRSPHPLPTAMLTLFHHPFCPHSRFIRLVLNELGLPAQLIEERVWERREEFLTLNPAGTVPVLAVDDQPPVPGAAII